MSVKPKHISIPKNVTSNNDLDFHYLRKLGIQYIEELGGSLWTDYNSHDPGITMLEMLCYAITDLGMRIDLPIEDLLAENEDTEKLSEQFYRASDIFPTKPVTQADYRRLFIDIDGVKNCWLRIAKQTIYADCKNDLLSYEKDKFEEIKDEFKKEYDLKGLYKLLVDFDEFDEELTDEEKEIEIDKIKAKIFEKYHANRNLCEDLIEIKEVPVKPISVCASIEVLPEADEELVHAKVLLAIENYFSPSLRFYSIKQMLEKGYTPDEIFDGPFVLDHGFIDPKELEAADLRSEVRLSDIMKLIMAIEGVKLINEITIGNCDSDDDVLNEWVICIPEDTKPYLCSKSVFSYNKGVLPLNINQSQVEEYQAELIQDAELANEITEDEKYLNLPQGRFMAPDTYTTIQNEFPETYGIGTAGLPANATTERKAQVKQLKGYLLFFDKILASYFKHLGEVKDLFSINGNLDKTYFAQVVEDIKDFEGLVNNYPTTPSTTSDAKLTESLFEQQDDSVARRNQILDHLLARFAEKFSDYAFLMKDLFGTSADEIVLSNKSAFLSDYIAISSERGAAFNYYKQPPTRLWDTDNISGVQKRISRLVGVKNYKRRTLSDSYVDIYTHETTDGDIVFRWHIKNESDAIVLSSTIDYNSISSASSDLYRSVLYIIQTKEKSVKNLSNTSIADGTIVDFVKIHQSSGNKYHFEIINPEEPDGSSNYIIAYQNKNYNTASELKEAILSIIDFMKFRFTEEGIFLVEHLLLRPHLDPESDTPKDSDGPFLPICTENCEDDCGIDPYSYRVSIVLPGYTYRFSNPDFRNYMENLIKEELPAHVLPKICWVGHRSDYYENQKLQFFQQLEKEENITTNSIEQQIEDLENQDPAPEDLDLQIAALNHQKMQTALAATTRKVEYLTEHKIITEENQEFLDNIEVNRNTDVEDLNQQIADLKSTEPVPENLDLQVLELEKEITQRSLKAEEDKMEYLNTLPDVVNDLVKFENAYKAYLLAKTESGHEQPSELEGLIDALNHLNTIYPVGRLIDCEDESDDIEGKVILGQTNIGTL